jgi:ABC-type transport system involved in multi-copper enzyme maturation permease subunit
MATTRGDGDNHPAKTLTLILGIAFTLVGLAGFIATGFDQFAQPTDETLLGFGVNPLHNIVHLGLGLAGLAMWRRLDTARTYGILTVAGYGLVLLYGLFVDKESDANFLSLNSADNLLHLVLTLAGVAVVVLASRRDITTGRAAGSRA